MWNEGCACLYGSCSYYFASLPINGHHLESTIVGISSFTIHVLRWVASGVAPVFFFFSRFCHNARDSFNKLLQFIYSKNQLLWFLMNGIEKQWGLELGEEEGVIGANSWLILVRKKRSKVSKFPSHPIYTWKKVASSWFAHSFSSSLLRFSASSAHPLLPMVLLRPTSPPTAPPCAHGQGRS